MVLNSGVTFSGGGSQGRLSCLEHVLGGFQTDLEQIVSLKTVSNNHLKFLAMVINKAHMVDGDGRAGIAEQLYPR